jgi:hypothetical protein
MTKHNPPRPGEFIAAVYLEPNGISGRDERDARLQRASAQLGR